MDEPIDRRIIVAGHGKRIDAFTGIPSAGDRSTAYCIPGMVTRSLRPSSEMASASEANSVSVGRPRQTSSSFSLIVASPPVSCVACGAACARSGLIGRFGLEQDVPAQDSICKIVRRGNYTKATTVTPGERYA